MCVGVRFVIGFGCGFVFFFWDLYDIFLLEIGFG